MKHVFLGLLLALSLTSQAQNIKKEVLFTIDGKPYYTDEFARVYKKNIDLVKDDSQKDLNQYLELFIGYKLKTSKAYKLKLQDNPKYQAELNTYRTQLAKNYLTDSKVTNELLQEAYSRYVKEVKASHILILVDENASPADTLKAYKQVTEIRNRALAGEDFGKLAAETSQDPTAKENKGELGYFSAFRMVYPFETGAYNTAKGQISKPVRSRFGYHLIKVEDIRSNRGEVSVEHIMITKPSEGNAEREAKAKSTIEDIYKKIQQGENFESLAQQFSEDKSSAPKGGALGRFGSGELSSEEFEEVAFSLTKDNPISKPFESDFGWHIIKLVDKFPVKSYEEMQAELEGRVKRDERSRLISNSMNEKLRKKFPLKRDDKLYASLQKTLTDDIYKGTWNVPANTTAYDKPLFSIKEKPVSGTSFLKYIALKEKEQQEIKPVTKLSDHLYDDFVNEQLNTFYNDDLENEFPEFADVMNEYRDGLLLFDLMEKEIWEKSKTDTLGLKNFFQQHQQQYRWKNRLDLIVASSTKEDIIKKAQKMLKQGKTSAEIKTELNTKDVVNVMLTEGTFEEGNDVIPSNTKQQTGVSEPLKKGDYYFTSKVIKVLPAGPKTLEESKGKAINDYQQYLEENWVSQLRKEFTINVDRDAFERVKKEINP